MKRCAYHLCKESFEPHHHVQLYCDDECVRLSKNYKSKMFKRAKRGFKHCTICQKAIPVGSKRQKYCGPECHTAGRRAGQRQRNNTKPMYLRACGMCGERFQPYKGRRDIKFCRQCQSVASTVVKRGHDPKEYFNRVCKECGERIPIGLSRRFYCNPKCSEIAHRKQDAIRFQERKGHMS